MGKIRLSTPSAFMQLEKGKKIRNVLWNECEYICFDSYGNLVDETGNNVDITIEKDMKWLIVD